jgi:hypothetical protein
LADFTASHGRTLQDVQSATTMERATNTENDLDQQAKRVLQPFADLEATHSCGVTVSVPPPLSTMNIYYVDGTGARAPFGGRSHGRSLMGTGQELDEIELEFAIPPLSDSASVADDLCSQSAYDKLLHHVLSERQYQKVDHRIVNLPSRSYIRLCVRHYFESFHSIFPFIRKSSFAHVASTEWLLLLAVAATGSRYLRRQQGESLGDMLITALDIALRSCRYGYGTETSHKSNDDRFVPGLHTRPNVCPDIPMLQAGILNIILLQHSGRRDLLERALVERHYLVQACHSLESISHTAHYNCMESALDPEPVQQWLVRESRVRVGMMIWVHDPPLSCAEVLLTCIVPGLHFSLRVQCQTFDGTRRHQVYSPVLR